MHSETINSWAKLCELAERASCEGGWLFRGQSHDNALRPKIGRGSSRKGKFDDDEKPYCPKLEQNMFERFKDTARPYLAKEPTNELEWLVIGQHHGLPTRLLDWTESPLVAAYFACEHGVSEKRSPRIYAIRGTQFISSVDFHWQKPFESENIVAFRPPHISPNIAPQMSAFTLHPVPHEDYSPDHLIVLKFEPDNLPFQVKQFLNQCGINRASLFPGIDGVAGHIGWCYKRNVL